MAHFLNRSDDIQLDLRQGPKTGDRQPWMQRHMQAQRLPKPLNQLGARGVWVPPPPPHSQGAIVKLWTAKASTTGVHANYLSRGKGLDGADAVLFGRDGPVDRQAFIHRARQDSHQIRAMISLDAGDRLNLQGFVQRLMRRFEADIDAPVSYLAAVHHDTSRVHAHVVIPGRDDHGKELYLTKHYWTYGFRYRAQGLATAMLGPVQQPLSARMVAALQRVRERLRGQEMSR
jgi:hypothetical protein